VEPTEEAIEAYRAFWEPATVTDPDVLPLWEGLRAEGRRVGVLSNTIWPREWHREFFARDGVLHLVDGDVYTCEIDWTKPDRRAFEAALEAVGLAEDKRKFPVELSLGERQRVAVARTVARMVELIGQIDPNSHEIADQNKFVRLVHVKEEHAERVKREVQVIWSDYFKPEHLEAAPDLHTKVWNVLKLASKNKQNVDAEAAAQLEAAVKEFADIFWATKK